MQRVGVLENCGNVRICECHSS